MPAKTRLLRLAVVLLAAVLAASCGSSGDTGKKNEGRHDPEGACPQKLPLKVTDLPSGFTSSLVKGPAVGQSQIKNVIIWHYNGPEGKVIEVFRGGQRHKFKNGKPVRSAGTIARTGKIDGGYAAKIRLGRGRCSRYVYEGRGLTEDEIKAVAAGLKRSGTSS